MNQTIPILYHWTEVYFYVKNVVIIWSMKENEKAIYLKHVWMGGKVEEVEFGK
jgi:hypothetical protein